MLRIVLSRRFHLLLIITVDFVLWTVIGLTGKVAEVEVPGCALSLLEAMDRGRPNFQDTGLGEPGLEKPPMPRAKERDD